MENNTVMKTKAITATQKPGENYYVVRNRKNEVVAGMTYQSVLDHYVGYGKPVFIHHIDRNEVERFV
jgi:hypothetical protein